MTNKKPEIRFSEFVDDWDEYKLGEQSEIKTGGTPNTGISEYWFPKEIPWMSSGEVHKKRLSYTDNKISKKGLENSSARWIKEKSILIALAGQGKTRGTVAINEIPLTTNQSIAAIEVDSSFDSEFVFQNLESRYEELRMISSGDGTRGGLNKQLVAGINIIAPSIKEQSKIGMLFKKLDNIISLHQSEHEKFANLKKAMLQKMFPQNGACVPEIRFKEFTDDWEQHKLGDLSEIRRGASPRPIQDPKWFDDKSEIGWLRISDVTEQDGRIHHVEQHISEEGQKKTLVLNEPHLILSIAATVGKPVINYIKTGIHDGFIVFIDPQFDKEFMFQWLEMFRPKWQKYGQPGSQVNINSELVRNQDVFVPSIKEQVKIGTFFKQLDLTISLHQEQINKLQQIKKSMQKKMLI